MARISKQDLIRLQKKFKTDARIGEEFDITRQAVHQLRKKYGIESRTASNPERNQEIVAMRDKGSSVESIAKKFKLSIPQTYRIIKETSSPKKPAAKKPAAKKPAAKTAAKKPAAKPAAKKPAAKKTAKKKK